MISRAYIHEYGNNNLEPEHLDVKTVLESRGIECELFTTKKLSRNQLNLDESTLVVGDHPTIETVFKRIKYLHSGNSYPNSLQEYFKREIWESKLKKILLESEKSVVSKIFIKPKSRTKLFTGFVVKSEQDLLQPAAISKNIDLYCSTVVEWLSEYRVFINDSKIVGIKHYEENPDKKLNLREVERAVGDFENSTDKTRAYSLDFGVLSTGETAFVEWNDAYALGSYGLDKTVYTDLIISRWSEVLNHAFDNSNETKKLPKNS